MLPFPAQVAVATEINGRQAGAEVAGLRPAFQITPILTCTIHTCCPVPRSQPPSSSFDSPQPLSPHIWRLKEVAGSGSFALCPRYVCGGNKQPFESNKQLLGEASVVAAHKDLNSPNDSRGANWDLLAKMPQRKRSGSSASDSSEPLQVLSLSTRLPIFPGGKGFA